MINKKSWDEFRETGLLWWINRILHTFGWAITCEVDESGHAFRAYPARVNFRGFTYEVEDRGFEKISTYLKENSKELQKETHESTKESSLKTGKIRKDENGHNYLIPKDNVELFDNLMDQVYECPEDGDKVLDLYNSIDSHFGKYRIDGISDLDIVMGK